MMDVVVLSKVLILFFVGSVTFWYMLTPYLVQPHPKILNDLVSNAKLQRYSDGILSPDQVEIENWTKWRLFVNSSSDPAEIVYGNSVGKISLENGKAVLYMEWRTEYEIHVSKSPELSAKRVEPASTWGDYGIYNHFFTEVVPGESKVKVVPRYLFGIKPEVVEDIYGQDVSDFPVVGVFTDSPKFDRIVIQCYMNIVTLSVIFLLYANNPPSAVGAKKKN